MSYSFRERLRMALKRDAKNRLKMKLGLSQKDADKLMDNIRRVCPISDEMLKALQKEMPRFYDKDIDQIIEEMTDAEFEDFLAEWVERALAKLGMTKKSKEEIEKEDAEEKEDEQEAEAEEAEAETEEEVEAECGEDK